MAKKMLKAVVPVDATDELLRKLIAVNLYHAGASYGAIAKNLGKGKTWVVASLRGLPDRRRK